MIRNPLKFHGGKNYLASRIIALMRPHSQYVEPFAGGLSVLLAKDPEGVAEVVNDLDKDLSAFWRVLQGGDSFRSFKRLCDATPFSEIEWQEADVEMTEWPEPDENVSSMVVRAWRFFIHCRQSMAGRRKSFCPPTRSRLRRGMNEQASEWMGAVDGLPEVHSRLRRVLILCRDAVDVIRKQDGEDVLFFCDPPYVPETRAAPDVYRKEMTVEQHEAMLAALLECTGKVILSGYPNDLYDRILKGWRVVDFDIANHAAGGKVKRRMVERVYMNYDPPSTKDSPLIDTLFDDGPSPRMEAK